MLAAVRRGVSADVHGYVGDLLSGLEGKDQLRTLRVKEARQLLRRVSRDPHLQRAYKRWREGRGDPAYVRYLDAVQRRTMRLVVDFDPTPPRPDSGLPEAQRTSIHLGHENRAALYKPYFDRFRQDVRSTSLSRALSALIARLHRLRERDLH